MRTLREWLKKQDPRHMTHSHIDSPMFFHLTTFFLPTFLFHFLFSCFFFACVPFFDGYLHSGRSKVTPATVGRDTNQSFRVCKVDLATLKVAENLTPKQRSKTMLNKFGAFGLEDAFCKS